MNVTLAKGQKTIKVDTTRVKHYISLGYKEVKQKALTPAPKLNKEG
ncbi:hypothetical protein AGMMS49975_16980 [Clostridia bacterium]|nr:hypothetical protein AGMMS49975_16980 [Clostridia bacterium]